MAGGIQKSHALALTNGWVTCCSVLTLCIKKILSGNARDCSKHYQARQSIYAYSLVLLTAQLHGFADVRGNLARTTTTKPILLWMSKTLCIPPSGSRRGVAGHDGRVKCAGKLYEWIIGNVLVERKSRPVGHPEALVYFRNMITCPESPRSLASTAHLLLINNDSK